MPCCGLTEYRRRVPFKLTLVGMIVFWSVFTATVLAGLAMSWRASGRLTLRTCGAFLGALWVDTMRQPHSIPAQWACRLSGFLLPVWPAAGEFVYRHPETPVFAGLLVLAGLIFGVVRLCTYWV